MKQKTTAIYVGRFAPFHNGHEATIQYMKNNFDESVVLIGSANRRRSLKNPFETGVIESWVKQAHPEVKVATVNDYMYDESKWITQVETIVNALSTSGNITLVGHDRDDSSYYLKEFPNWQFHEMGVLADDISGTELRKAYFRYNLNALDVDMNQYKQILDSIKLDVPSYVHSYMNAFTSTNEYKLLAEERLYHTMESDKFNKYPYPETLKLCCSDMVVSCSGNILLIQRKTSPGEGIWALPGGFTNSRETFIDAAVRELYEETGLKVPEKILRSSIQQDKMFDDPKRSEGLTRISYAFYADIKPDYVGDRFPKLPKVKASDDAADAKWIPLAEIKGMQLFDDHADIINYFTKSL